jgi:RimJ/RimL family protein N-acetyltransferase
MAAYVDRAVAARDADDQHAFATWSVADDRIVGSTRFYDLTPWEWSARAPGAEDRQRVGRPDRASIGYTWLAPAAQRRAVNTEAKLLMLTHAFEVWEVYAVHLKTDARNARSRAAIERIGCTLDGIVRADMPASDGTVRDSAVFSMTAEEWPDRKSRLTARLAGSAG